MTVTEMDADLEDARSFLSVTRFEVRRCEHETVTSTALWVFDDGRQIACIVRNEGSLSKYRWRANKMRNSQPITEMPFQTLAGACAYVIDCCGR